MYNHSYYLKDNIIPDLHIIYHRFRLVIQILINFKLTHLNLLLLFHLSFRYLLLLYLSHIPVFVVYFPLHYLLIF